jgi:hypothetical protein
MTETVLPPRWRARPLVERPHGGGPFLVSVNELNSFRRCPQAWDITSPSRQSLHRVGMPAPALNIGSAVHFALASQALGGDPLAAVLIYFQDGTDQLRAQYKERIGTDLSTGELNELDNQREMVLGMLRAYLARYGKREPTKPYYVVAPEVTFKIPLVEEYDIWLVGTIDRVHVDQYGNLIVGECKTYKTKPKREGWRFNNQIYGYAAALQFLTGEKVKLALYDGLRKKAPIIPKVLKDGTLSTAWIDTTHSVYRRKLLEVYGGDKSILSHPAYAPMLSRLKTRDLSNESVFHTRFRVPISQAYLEKWWDAAQATAMQMKHQPRIDPVFDWQGCPMCRVRRLCHAIQGDEDLAPILEDYAVGQTHTRQAQTIATPDNIRSASDLVSFAGSMDPDRPFAVTTKAESDSE